jgi:hypothetical protein
MKIKKYIRLFTTLIFVASIGACNLLEIDPPTGPTSENFISNEAELNMSLNAAYRTLLKPSGYGNPMQQVLDNGGTDIGVGRIATAAGSITLGNGTITTSDGDNASYYKFFYESIGRANYILENIHKIKDYVNSTRYDQYIAEARFIRAYHYMYLTELWGDVPYIDFVARNSQEALLPRTAKPTICDNMLEDLTYAAGVLPAKWTGDNLGRITKGAALGLKARIALYNSRWNEAAQAAAAAMALETEAGYALHADYQQLFSRAGEGNKESMLSIPYKDGFSVSSYPNVFGSRKLGMTSNEIPTQAMVDSYEAADGLPIDKSKVYDPTHPYNNRDPRLLASIVTPQSIWGGIIFESHKDSLISRKADGSYNGQNNDSRGIIWAANFCGYLWKKYADEESQMARSINSEIDFMLMRYAEILLIYAEAKIELGEIDQAMLDASINRVRARAYKVTNVTNGSLYPRITTLNKNELRTIIKRERKVELANEGFRLFDIRRWRIAYKVMPVKVYGRPLDIAHATGIPSIDEDGHIDYTVVARQYDDNPSAFPNAQGRTWNDKLYLNPIPQTERDVYSGNGLDLPQNPGY